MGKILFVDLETTGFSREWDFIIEVAAILYDKATKKEVARFHEYIRPGKRIPQNIIGITGITNEQVADCRSEREVLADFFEWLAIIDPEEITAYNAPFDKSFLVNKQAKYKLAMKDKEWLDMMKYGRQLRKEGKTENYRQTTIAAYFGIAYDAHSAIEDVKALIQIYEKLGIDNTVEAQRKSLGF